MLEEGPTESPIADMMQNPEELLPFFIISVQTSLERKLPSSGLRDQFTKLLIWEGINKKTRMPCAGLRLYHHRMLGPSLCLKKLPIP